jgi:glycosyltransferase involved in cell wall biosynthesis
LRPATSFGFEILRRWDRTTIDNVDHYIANSHNVAERVQRCYRRDAAVVYPPIALDHFDPQHLVTGERDCRHYLTFGALTPYKNVALAVETFNASGKRLIVVGEGSERSRLERMARPNVSLVGALPWAEVRSLIQSAHALVFPGEEDFGLVPLEVMAHGVPVVALGRGGALETVIDVYDQPDRSTGVLFEEPTSAGLAGAIERFETLEHSFDPGFIRCHARRFGEDFFQTAFAREVQTLMGETVTPELAEPAGS